MRGREESAPRGTPGLGPAVAAWVVAVERVIGEWVYQCVGSLVVGLRVGRSAGLSVCRCRFVG